MPKTSFAIISGCSTKQGFPEKMGAHGYLKGLYDADSTFGSINLFFVCRHEWTHLHIKGK